MTNTANLSETAKSSAPKVHLFNPANDEALASNNRWHTPSRHALQYQHDCELLPIWWADDGDYIIAPHHTDAEIEATSRKANVKVNRYHPGTPAYPEPWGWSLDAKRQFQEAGVPDDCLPAGQYISWLRELSHRRLAIDVNAALTKRSGISAPNHPRIYTDTSALDVRGGDSCLLKRPWSSSGRGIFPTSTLTDDELKRLANGIIRRQGSVIVEDALPKVADMSALFYSDCAAIRHRAWSLFQTTSDGRYIGSIVAPQTDITSSLQTSGITYGDKTIDLAYLAGLLADILTDIISVRYHGWIGVDMLAYRCGDALLLAPCIEVNLRMTMGVVATLLASRRAVSDTCALLRTLPPGVATGDGCLRLAGRDHRFSIVLEPHSGLPA